MMDLADEIWYLLNMQVLMDPSDILLILNSDVNKFRFFLQLFHLS